MNRIQVSATSLQIYKYVCTNLDKQYFNLKKSAIMARPLRQIHQLNSKSSDKIHLSIKAKPIKKKIRPEQIRKHLIQMVSAKDLANRMSIMNKSVQKHFNSQVKKMVEAEHVTCPICFEIIVGPILTQCGHIFCLRCIESASFLNQQCPICRESLENQSFKQSKKIKNIILQYINQHLPLQQRKAYELKSQKLEETQRRRKLPWDLKKNDLVDYNYHQKWISAQVLQIYNTFIVIQVCKKGRTSKINVYLRQRKLARHRTFTQEPPLRPTYFAQKFNATEPILRFIVEPDYLSSETLERNPPQVGNVIVQEYFVSRWDEFDLMNTRDLNWINQDADLNLQRNVQLWNPTVQVIQDSLFS